MIEVSGFNTGLTLLIIMFIGTIISVYKFKTGGYGIVSALWLPLAFFEAVGIIWLGSMFVRFV